MVIYYKSAKVKISRGKINLGIMVVLAVFLLGIIYFVQINKNITQTYQLISYKGEIKRISEENKKLQVEVARAKSLPTLKKAIEGLNMEQVVNLEYLDKLDKQMAIKN